MNVILPSTADGGPRCVLRSEDKIKRNGSQLFSLKFTGDHERAADDLGWELLQNARINPQGTVNFLAELKAEIDAKGKGSFGPGAVFLSTHPTPQERIEPLG